MLSLKSSRRKEGEKIRFKKSACKTIPLWIQTILRKGYYWANTITTLVYRVKHPFSHQAWSSKRMTRKCLGPKSQRQLTKTTYRVITWRKIIISKTRRKPLLKYLTNKIMNLNIKDKIITYLKRKEVKIRKELKIIIKPLINRGAITCIVTS